MPDVNKTITTIANLTLGQFLQVALAAMLAFFFWNEYYEDAQDTAAQEQSAGNDELTRDLLVALRVQQGVEVIQEARQDERLDDLEDNQE